MLTNKTRNLRVITLILGLSVVGCDRNPNLLQEPKLTLVSSNVSSSEAINAGVIIAEVGGYYCCTYEQLGLRPDCELAYIASSCECVSAESIVCFDGKSEKPLVLFTFPPSSTVDSNMVRLAIDITFKTKQQEAIKKVLKVKLCRKM